MHPRSVFFLSLAISSTVFTLLTSPSYAKAEEAGAVVNLVGAQYQSTPSTYLDFTGISTLSDFNRLVYRYRWERLKASDIIAALGRFKAVPHSPAMRDVWRDILLSDFKGIKATREEQITLMSERIRLLNRLGYFDEAVRLYQEASKQKPIPELIARQGIEAMVLSGSADGACLEVMMASVHLQGDAWNRDGALCAAYFGNKEQADSLYKKAAANGGSGFKAAYRMLNKGDAKTIHVGIPALWRTLLLAKGASISSKALKNADGMTLASISMNVKVPLGTRLNAAVRAAEHSTVGADHLRKLYERVHTSDSGLESIKTSAINNESLPQQQYYAAARFTFSGPERSKIVRNAISHLSVPTNIKSHVYGWIVDKLTLQIDQLSAFAPHGYALMVATNRMKSANMYYDIGKLHSTPFAIVQAMLEGKPWDPQDYKTWETAMRDTYKDDADTRINRLFMTLKAYDQEQKFALAPLSPKTRNDSSNNNSSLLQESLRKGGKGLALIDALNIMAEKKSLNQLENNDFADLIAILTKQGLFAERKKLTLEFFIQAML